MWMPSFHSSGMFSSSQICLKRFCRMSRMLTAVSLSALMASAGISSRPSAFLFVSAVIALLISVLDGLLQCIGKSVSAGCISGGLSGVGIFNMFYPSYHFLYFWEAVFWVSGVVFHHLDYDSSVLASLILDKRRWYRLEMVFSLWSRLLFSSIHSIFQLSHRGQVLLHLAVVQLIYLRLLVNCR